MNGAKVLEVFRDLLQPRTSVPIRSINSEDATAKGYPGPAHARNGIELCANFRNQCAPFLSEASKATGSSSHTPAVGPVRTSALPRRSPYTDWHASEILHASSQGRTITVWMQYGRARDWRLAGQASGVFAQIPASPSPTRHCSKVVCPVRTLPDRRASFTRGMARTITVSRATLHTPDAKDRAYTRSRSTKGALEERETLQFAPAKIGSEPGATVARVHQPTPTPVHVAWKLRDDVE